MALKQRWGAGVTTSIQSLGAPLAFQPANSETLSWPGRAANPVAAVRVFARALEGMQKEAVVVGNHPQAAWRFVCDEGHYLNGTDLAPPPLAFFSAGMASLFTSAIAAELAKSKHDCTNLTVHQDAYYAMEGSALRGTMTASADSVVLTVSTTGGHETGDLSDRLTAAIAKSPAEALMRTKLADTFSLQKNSTAIDTGTLRPSSMPDPGEPTSLFRGIDYPDSKQHSEAVVCKLESAPSVFEEDHGTGAALKDQQKRMLLIRSQATIRADGIQQIRVQIYRPIGSVFQFLVDETTADNGNLRAPDSLSYLSAGIAFCYMTQLGRYVQIAKKQVDHYSIVQDTGFDIAAGHAYPVDTHVYLDTPEDDETCRTIANMGEQTCFLHAACRMSNKTRLGMAAAHPAAV